jgi:protein SCO1/2
MYGFLNVTHPKDSLLLTGRASIWILLIVVFSLMLSDTVFAATTNYTVRGIVKKVDRPAHQVVIAHEAIPGFMDSMSMPFNVKDEAVPADLAAGTAIEFQFHMNDSESWINGIRKIASSSLSTNVLAMAALAAPDPQAAPSHAVSWRDQSSLYHFKFTNELGQSVSLSDFHGQAIALTFFFTRCPVVDFCPRLSRNFQEAQRELLSMKDGPTNWHLISVSFDTGHDTSEILKAYAKNYQYDPAHWTFLTGPKDKISELAEKCNMQFTETNGFFDHNFRTLIIDASNRLQMVFPTSGDLSKDIAHQLLTAAHPTEKNLKREAKN